MRHRTTWTSVVDIFVPYFLLIKPSLVIYLAIGVIKKYQVDDRKLDVEILLVKPVPRL